jgi:adenylate cyclase
VEQRHAERKLAAILAADVAGYSRLMGADEDGTLAQLKAHRRALVDPKVKEHRGKIIKTTGDGILVEFASVVDAVRCAVGIQRGMAERNAGVPPDKRIEFRVGINLGDIIHDDKDIFGDGVNVAARLEGLAEPGGICISRSVRDPVRDRLGFTFEDIGEQALKNIAAPIHAYRVRFEGTDPTARAPPLPPSRKRNFVAALVIGLAGCAILAIAVVVWPSRAPAPRVPVQPAAVAQSAPLPLPDKPSIAVLPFTNIGGDAKQERLADGITEDVITDLSRYRDLFVIARNSVFAYKGKAVSVQQVGRELGVRYVLEGSIQTSGDRVRVTAQLIEAATNAHVWSDRYDRALGDIFDVQNEVTQKIAGALGGMTGTLALADAASVRRMAPANLQAYDYYVLGVDYHFQHNREGNFKAEAAFKKAIELDPHLARAYVGLGRVYLVRGSWGWGESAPSDYERAKSLELKAIELDSADATAYALLGEIYFFLSDYDRGLGAFQQALVLNPNDPTILVKYGGTALFLSGRSQEGVEMINRAYRLNPHYEGYYDSYTDPFYVLGQYDEVIAKTLRRRGELDLQSQLTLILTYAQLGRETDMAAARTELLRRYPDFSLERWLSDFGTIKDQPTLARYLDGARKAGLRDCATPADLQKYPKMKHLAACDAKRAS